MYRSSPPSVVCPECAIGLTHVEARATGDVALYACTRCGGAWFDAPASMAVLQGKADPSEVQRRSNPPAPRSGPERSRPCARCGEAMLPYPFGGVMLDTCPAHGTWFDHEEIERVVKAARKMAKDDERGVDLPKGSEVWATAKFTIGMIVLPFTALASLLAGHITGAPSSDDDDY